MRQRKIIWRIAIFTALIAVVIPFARSFADDHQEAVVNDEDIAGEITELNDKITDKKSDIDSLNRNIDAYKKKIAAAQSQSVTLLNETELLLNRIAKSELEIEATTEEISVVNDEIDILEKRLTAIEKQLDENRATLSDILRKMDVYDNDLTLHLLFSTESFGDLFDRLQELTSVSDDLEGALKRAQAEKERVALDRTDLLGKLTRLDDLHTRQESQMRLLEEEKKTKETLLVQSESNEATFQLFLSELRAEQQYVNTQIAALQEKIEKKLLDVDDGGQGSSVLSWPVDPYKGLSTTFHDPTYPFRHLFEHSGIDVPTPQGTAVKSGAPGYVAWTRTGRLYGNYVMVIHSDGVATLYAHLSSISVVQDQFVSRGMTVGLSGGQPGTAGAGLSTGPHLHFEVREQGIPVDPMGYLLDR